MKFSNENGFTDCLPISIKRCFKSLFSNNSNTAFVMASVFLKGTTKAFSLSLINSLEEILNNWGQYSLNAKQSFDRFYSLDIIEEHFEQLKHLIMNDQNEM